MSEPAPALRSVFRTRLKRVLVVVVGIYLLYGVGCATFQRRFIYFPPVIAPEQAAALGRAEGLAEWTAADGQHIGWKRLCSTQPAAGQVVVFHGNAGSAVGRAYYANVIQEAAPFDVFLMEYPGYAEWPGSPSEASFDLAAEAACEGLATNLPTYLVGESLGSGVATFIAGRYPGRIAGIVLLGPYNRLSAVGQEQMPLLPVGLLLRDGFRSDEYLRQYHGPLAVLVAGRDTVVPEKFGRRLYDGYDGPKKVWEFPEGNHGTVMSQPAEVWREIVDFWGRKK